MRVIAVLTLVLGLAMPATAQNSNDDTLADIRQQLTVLFGEMQRLKRELSTTGAPQTGMTGGSVLARVDAIEIELQRLTSKTEELEFRIDRIVRDGTNRIGDLEFRLVELEGGDVSQLGETTTLGGQAVTTAATPVRNTGGGAEMAIGEEHDFKSASDALASGDYDTAITLFAQFTENYPGGPLASEADLRRGQALEGQGDATGAARAYLDSFSGDPQGPVADESLFRLGNALAALGKPDEGCVMLDQVGVRFPNSPFVSQAQSRRTELNCL